MADVVNYVEGMKVRYAHMFSEGRNTHTKEQINQLIKQWPENKIMLQFGFGWKGAHPHTAASREDAINYGWEDADTDSNGNLILTKYGANDYW